MKKFFFTVTALATALTIIGGGCAPMIENKGDLKLGQTDTRKYSQFKEIVNPSGYVNTEKITIGELIGKKVILLDILTYSCINCIRTFPYLNDWYKKYQDDGLEIIGIHTPEFAFEKKRENVVEAMTKYGIEFPIVLDNDYGTWNAYGNRYWPRKYLIDINGNIVFDHIGEGGYAETEAKIQELLKERMQKLGMKPIVPHEVNTEKEPDLDVGSPEVYFGSERNELLSNGKKFTAGVALFTAPEQAQKNALYLGGEWNITGEHAENKSKKARIMFRYSAKQVNIVASADTPVSVQILVDGKPVGKMAGSDVKNGVAEVQDERLYELVNDPSGAGEHTLEMIVDNPGLKAFTFTFG